MSIKKSIKDLTAMLPSKTNKHRAYADQVLNLFKDRKIEKRKEAEKLLEQLASRGKGPQSAINKINEKYSKAESATGKLDRRELRDYFVSGTTHHIITYEQKLKKAGTIKARSYEIETPFAVPIKAKNKEDAEEKAQAWSAKTWILGEGADSYAGKSKKFTGAKIKSVSPITNFTPAREGSQLMRAAQPVEYSFIPTDHSLIKTPGFCVLDQFLGIYSPLIKHMNKDYFINLCYEVRGEQRPAKKIISALDVGIEGIEDDSDSEAWTIKDGVSPDMLKQICMREDISHYCFDITRKCFSKHVSKHRNYPSLVYYCINNHMYWISDKEKAYNLVQQAR